MSCIVVTRHTTVLCTRKLKGSRDGAAEQVVRCGYSTNSPRLDDLLDGEEIEVFESIVDPVTNIPRVRTKDGITSAPWWPY